MPTKEEMIAFFIDLDSKLEEKTNICFFGGCFFVLMGIKSSSPDIDILVNGDDYSRVTRAIREIKDNYPFKVDVLTDRWLGEIRLPENFMKTAKPYRRYRSKMNNIKLWQLSIYDMIISKIARWQEKDIKDIETLLTVFRVKRNKLQKRINHFDIHKKIEFKEHQVEFYNLFDDKLKDIWDFF